MNHTIRVAAVSLNQTALDWDANLANMQAAINHARDANSQLLVMPELSVTGYGCEDGFFGEGIAAQAIETIYALRIPADMAVIVGLPVEIHGRLYNGAALLYSRSDQANEVQVAGIYLKQNLAKNGIHYEPRWFNAWPQGQTMKLKISRHELTVGDVVFDLNGVKLGFEICEDAWIANRPGIRLFEQGIDIIINPSASHFAIGKHHTREQFVVEGSRCFGAAYIYSNLNGCESGRVIFDGGNMIASGGRIVSRGARLFYKPFEVSIADIDPWENKLVHQISSQSCLPTEDKSVFVPFHWLEPNTQFEHKLPASQSWQNQPCHLDHEEAIRAVALGLYDWMRKTQTKGFTLSLSGGADSALVAAAVALMIRFGLAEYHTEAVFNAQSPVTSLKQLLPEGLQQWLPEQLPAGVTGLEDIAKMLNQQLLTTIYQGTKNSGQTTLNAARTLAEGMGAEFHSWVIDQPVAHYTKLVEASIRRQLSWADSADDLALQNIQARARAPGIWMMANVKNQLLLTTGNLSESSVGYMTQDGDTAGVLAPIIGIRKTRVRELLRWLCEEGACINHQNTPLPYLSQVVKQQPTAELRPGLQTDEEDLMPFPILDAIVTQSLMLRRSAIRLHKVLCDMFPDTSAAKMAGYLLRYYQLFDRNQWKRDRSAPGFHIELDSLDPKTFARFPLLNGGHQRELAQLRELMKQHAD